MKVIIVEDEPINVAELKDLISSLNSSIEIVSCIDTIEAAVTQFKKAQPDLIFMDIELADGSAFEIFEEVNITCPIIFTTAYDEYALKAFEQNSIAYLLKPITKSKLENAFDNLRQMETAVLKSSEYKKVFNKVKRYKTNFLVRLGNSLVPINADKILYFYSENNLVFVVDEAEKKYLTSFSLTQLEEVLNPAVFFRMNRQYIAHQNAVTSLKQHVKGQVLVNLKTSTDLEIIVSRQKTIILKEWLS